MLTLKINKLRSDEKEEIFNYTLRTGLGKDVHILSAMNLDENLNVMIDVETLVDRGLKIDTVEILSPSAQFHCAPGTGSSGIYSDLNVQSRKSIDYPMFSITKSLIAEVLTYRFNFLDSFIQNWNDGNIAYSNNLNKTIHITPIPDTDGDLRLFEERKSIKSDDESTTIDSYVNVRYFPLLNLSKRFDQITSDSDKIKRKLRERAKARKGPDKGDDFKIIEPGHKYQLKNFEGSTDEQIIQFIQKELVTQHKFGADEDVLETVADGTTNEAVIQVLINRMNFLNAKFPCRENSIVITKLEEALMWLNKRTDDRNSIDEFLKDNPSYIKGRKYKF